jgi:hypothetical protein
MPLKVRILVTIGDRAPVPSDRVSRLEGRALNLQGFDGTAVEKVIDDGHAQTHRMRGVHARRVGLSGHSLPSSREARFTPSESAASHQEANLVALWRAKHRDLEGQPRISSPSSAKRRTQRRYRLSLSTTSRLAGESRAAWKCGKSSAGHGDCALTGSRRRVQDDEWLLLMGHGLRSPELDAWICGEQQEVHR